MTLSRYLNIEAFIVCTCKEFPPVTIKLIRLDQPLEGCTSGRGLP